MKDENEPHGLVQVKKNLSQRSLIFILKSVLAGAVTLMRVVRLYQWIRSWFDHS